MIRSSKLSYSLILLVLIILLSGCELARTEGEESDLQPVSEIPPTLAPLGADSETTGAATAIPTVINVQSDSAGSSTVEGETAVAGLGLMKCLSVFDDACSFNPAYDEEITHKMAADHIILAVGQAADLTFLGKEKGVNIYAVNVA